MADTLVADVAAPAAQTLWIHLDRIDIPQDARPHTPDEIEDMAQELQSPDGQLQEIVVVKTGERYEVRAGICRTLAARSLKWEKIRCLVKEGVSAFDKLRITFAENETRKNASPLYQAQVLQGMLDTKEVNTQEELAGRLRSKRGSVSQYLMIGQLDPKVKEIANRLANLGIRHLLQICRLKTPEDQVSLAQEASQKELSVNQLKALVDKKVGKGEPTKASPPSPLPKGEGGQRPGEADPLSSLWSRLKPKVTAASWDVTCPQKGTWSFQVKVSKDEGPVSRLYYWAQDLADALKPEVFHDAEDSGQCSEVEEDDPAPKRLPQNPAEEAELEAEAQKGPAAFYAWVYGNDSPTVQEMQGQTWQDLLGIADSKVASQTLLQAIRAMAQGAKETAIKGN